VLLEPLSQQTSSPQIPLWIVPFEHQFPSLFQKQLSVVEPVVLPPA